MPLLGANHPQRSESRTLHLHIGVIHPPVVRPGCPSFPLDRRLPPRPVHDGFSRRSTRLRLRGNRYVSPRPFRMSSLTRSDLESKDSIWLFNSRRIQLGQYCTIISSKSLSRIVALSSPRCNRKPSNRAQRCAQSARIVPPESHASEAPHAALAVFRQPKPGISYPSP